MSKLCPEQLNSIAEIKTSVIQCALEYIEREGKGIEEGVSSAPPLYRALLTEIRAGVVEAMLIRNFGNQAATARELGINRSTLATYIKSSKMKKQG